MNKIARLCWWCNNNLMRTHATASNGTKVHHVCLRNANEYLRGLTGQPVGSEYGYPSRLHEEEPDPT